jgi:hypothetical protein
VKSVHTFFRTQNTMYDTTKPFNFILFNNAHRYSVFILNKLLNTAIYKIILNLILPRQRTRARHQQHSEVQYYYILSNQIALFFTRNTKPHTEVPAHTTCATTTRGCHFENRIYCHTELKTESTTLTNRCTMSCARQQRSEVQHCTAVQRWRTGARWTQNPQKLLKKPHTYRKRQPASHFQSFTQCDNIFML